MIIWLDAHLSPTLAPWIQATFGVEAHALRDLGLRDAKDPEIFQAARASGAIIMTKDSDFITLQERYGSPPQIIWLTCGNTSNLYLQTLLIQTLPKTLELLQAGEDLVEISAV